MVRSEPSAASGSSVAGTVGASGCVECVRCVRRGRRRCMANVERAASSAALAHRAVSRAVVAMDAARRAGSHLGWARLGVHPASILTFTLASRCKLVSGGPAGVVAPPPCTYEHLGRGTWWAL